MKTRILTLAVLLFSAALNAQRWTQLNPPVPLFNNTIFTTVVDKAGNVYAAGAFKDSAGENAIAFLNNQNNRWSELGVGLNTLHAKGNIYSLAFDPAGNLYAGGAFYDSSGHDYVAKWNGNYWSETGPASSAQNFTGQIFTLTSDNSGNIYAAGELIDSVGHYYVSKFDGTNWQTLGTGPQSLNANGVIYSVIADANGNIYAAGQFTDSSGKCYVAKWNGTNWSALGTDTAALNANSSINSLALDSAGNIYAAGDFKDGSGKQYVAKWRGDKWIELGPLAGSFALAANGMINTISIDANNHLYAAGMFTDTTGATFVSQWSGGRWSAVSATQGIFQFNNFIYSLSFDPSGNLYAGGNFTDLQGNQFVAKDSAGIWTDPGVTGGRMPDQSNPMTAMAVDTGGDVFVVLSNGGAVGVQPPVLRWNGSTWITLSDTANGAYAYISGLAPDSLGNMYAWGTFNGTTGVAKWNGSAWITIPTSGGITISSVSSLATDPKGNLYVSGTLTANGILKNLAKWDGSNWTAFAVADVLHFVVNPNGIIYATVADYSNSGYNVVRIEGENVTRIGNTTTQTRLLNATNWMDAIVMDGKGNIYVGGSLDDANGNVFVAKWDGTNWTVLGTDTNSFGASGQIEALAFDGYGNLFAGGNLLKQSGTYVAKWNGSSWITVGDANDFFAQQTLGFFGRDGRGNIYGEVGNNIYRYIGAQSPALVCYDSAKIHLVVNKSTVTDQSTTIEIDAKGIPGDGTTTYWIEFASDRDFTNILSGPSGDSVLPLSSGSLVAGPNTIYAKMQTTDKCSQTNVSIDSVTITKTSMGGIVDPDFPNSAINTYPNPVSSNVYVNGLSATKSYTIQIYNSLGVPVSQVTVTGQTDANINFSTPPSGLYMMQVYDNSKNRRIGVITMVKGK